MKQFYLSLLIFALFSASFFAQQPVQTKVQNGIIEGFKDPETKISHYFGIPFAQPPVGELRWKAPQPMTSWSGVKETKQFGPSPVQANVFGDMEFRAPGQSEDCLYLNVWTPAAQGEKLPVLVYFYGGGFVAGDASEPRYDGAAMAQKGIVVVTINYRLNIFGFLAHPELSREASYQASGNYGLLDQHAALQWVQDNIEAFSGDPDRVTIAGESAGSISVSAQMASPLSKNLISGAIGESGAAIHPTLAPVPLQQAEQIGVAFVEKAGYTSIAEMRKEGTKEIFEKYKESGAFGFPGVIDEYFLPKSLPEIFSAGEQAQVPLLLGWNSAEIPGYAFTQGPYSEENYLNKLKEAFPENYEEALELYPAGSEKQVELSATALVSDRFIAYSTWKWFDLHRKNSNAHVYRYLYSKLRPPLKDQNKEAGLAGGTMEREENSQPPAAVGAPHAAEIEYFMGNLDRIDSFAWTEDDYKVSEFIQQYLANFIKTGNPNSTALPHWPTAEAIDTTPPVMILDVEPRAVDAQHDARYLFLDRQFSEK